MNKISQALEANAQKMMTLSKKEAEPPSTLSVDAEEDYNLARATMHDLVSKSTSVLDGLVDLCHESEHPRTYEVLANLIRSISDISNQMLDLQQKKQKLSEPTKGVASSTPAPSTTTNNTIFVGSTTDLQKYLTNRDMKKAEDIDELS